MKIAAASCFKISANDIRNIIEGPFQIFQRFPSSKLVLKTVESHFETLNYCENGRRNL